jgi:hypothetical protein
VNKTHTKIDCGLDAFTLKVVAIVAMTIDHVGVLLYPEQLWLRVIGRLTIPIIAFLLVEGYHNTSNLGRYMLRILLFALIAQPIYRLAFPHGLNVLFDLIVGLGVIWITDRIRSPWLQALLLAGVSALAVVVVLDWWHLAVLIIFVFHKTRGHFRHTVFATIALLAANSLVFVGVSRWTGEASYAIINAINLGCVLALPLISCYNGRRGRDARYVFYGYYPVHLLALWGIRSLWS